MSPKVKTYLLSKNKSKADTLRYFLFAGYSELQAIDLTAEYFDIKLPIYEDKVDTAFNRLRFVADIINDGWKPNWEDEKEYKYYPWFNMKGGFTYYDTYYHNTTHTSVPSALFYKTQKLAEFAGKNFIDLYKLIMVK